MREPGLPSAPRVSNIHSPMSLATTTSSTSSLPPRPGLLARVRNRYGLITSVRADDGADGRFHLVTVEYLDSDGVGQEELLWEAEVGTHLVEPTALPPVDSKLPMVLEQFRALERATRWSALEPYVDPDGEGGPLERSPLASPLHGAIQPEDYQMLPLWQAMRMPRVSLLLADDVGLGKTIEAGLILSELVRRRRARRVLILCPASLRQQWIDELSSKFCLEFDLVDRARTHELRRRFGMDANPWRSMSRIVTSYDYLKQPDVLQSFRAASRSEDQSRLPWDLLIVDEAHNLAPAPIGTESAVAQLLKQIAPNFEHRLFLTATPHNGHTSSFTGLLEALDPVRFSRKWEPLTKAEKDRIDQVLVRRLKRDVNDRDRAAGRTPRFGERELTELPLRFGRGETALMQAFAEFRTRVRKLVASKSKSEERAGVFAVEILGKRLLSCPTTFADSWHRYLEGAEGDDSASAEEVEAAERSSAEELTDDREAERRRTHAVATVGAWLRPLIDSERLREPMAAIGGALDDLGLAAEGFSIESARPVEDARFAELTRRIDELLRDGDGWRPNERLVVFTEYKTTLDHLEARLREHYAGGSDDGVIRVLFGGLHPKDRADVTDAFNDPRDPVRILLATDTASEGLNLQETARYLLHYDVPWNPSRLEQRNGRLDRHGQARDVRAFHFSSEAEDDVRFLGRVVSKVHQQREDLGSVGEVFDLALEKRLVEGADADSVLSNLDAGLAARGARTELATRDDSAEDWHRGERERERLDALMRELDLAPDTLRSTLDIALSGGRGALEGPDDDGTFRLHPSKIGADWNQLVDDSLRARTGTRRSAGPKGSLDRLVFDSGHFLRSIDGESDRKVFRPQANVSLLHLGHPLFHRALGHFARFRFPGNPDADRVTRWVLTRPSTGRGPIPGDADGLLLLTVEELAVNDLRETFHHWVRTLAVPLHRNGDDWSLGNVLPHRPFRDWHADLIHEDSEASKSRAKDAWLEVEDAVKELLVDRQGKLHEELSDALAQEFTTARETALDLFQSRQGELSTLIQNQTVDRLEREIEKAKADLAQGQLFDAHSDRIADLERDIKSKEAEVERRKLHWESLRTSLEQERTRAIERVLPLRHAIHDQARVFPVAVEIVFPGGDQ